jgi:hypothetical protein
LWFIYAETTLNIFFTNTLNIYLFTLKFDFNIVLWTRQSKVKKLDKNWNFCLPLNYRITFCSLHKLIKINIEIILFPPNIIQYKIKFVWYLKLCHVLFFHILSPITFRLYLANDLSLLQMNNAFTYLGLKTKNKHYFTKTKPRSKIRGMNWFSISLLF